MKNILNSFTGLNKKLITYLVIAIGGITKDNIKDLAGSGICGIAVISAIFAQKDIEAATAELKERTVSALK